MHRLCKRKNVSVDCKTIAGKLVSNVNVNKLYPAGIYLLKVNSEHISCLLVFLLLTLSKWMPTGYDVRILHIPVKR